MHLGIDELKKHAQSSLQNPIGVALSACHLAVVLRYKGLVWFLPLTQAPGGSHPLPIRIPSLALAAAIDRTPLGAPRPLQVRSPVLAEMFSSYPPTS